MKRLGVIRKDVPFSISDWRRLQPNDVVGRDVVECVCEYFGLQLAYFVDCSLLSVIRLSCVICHNVDYDYVVVVEFCPCDLVVCLFKFKSRVHYDVVGCFCFVFVY